ncbi:MAG TPA: PRC-barrel domain-containing protein [Ktedonobacterales bacterium]|nr:PRC-barrel domain-containing protein [Ktedonobacterales bacterium]
MREEAEAAAVAEPESQAGWFISQLWRRPVVDVRAIERLGQVADIVFDAPSRRILGVRIERETQEHPVVEVARRALAGAIGASYISAAQIIALHKDAVTVDLERPTESGERLESYPHLSHVQGFAVLTLAGKRLGRLVDIRVDDEGRRILSYLVQPGGHGVARNDMSLRPRRLYAWHQSLTAPEDGAGPPAARDPGASNGQTAIAIAATHEVRVGRDLIIVVDPAETERQHTAPPTGAAPEEPEPPTPHA